MKTDSNTELLLFFYIQKRIEMVSEEIGILVNNHLSGEQDSMFERMKMSDEEKRRKEEYRQSVASVVNEKNKELETYKTKRDALMEIIEGEVDDEDSEG